MNSTENTPENTSPDQSRPFGFWITAVDRLLAAEFATAFEDEGITRRDWRILNVIDGTVAASHELADRKLRRLAALGWIERTADGWALTADGAAGKARLATAVEEIRAQVAGALDPEEFAALAASLEKLARGLGYEEGRRLPRRRAGERHRGGHGRGHRGYHRGHGEHHHETGSGRGERFARGEQFDRSERPGFGRFDQHPGFGREWLEREHLRHEHLRHEHRCGGRPDGEHSRGGHRHGEHSRGKGPRGGFRPHAPEQIHIHLHDGRHDG